MLDMQNEIVDSEMGSLCCTLRICPSCFRWTV